MNPVELKIDHEIYDRAKEKKLTDVEKVIKEGEIVQIHTGTDTDGRGIIIYDRIGIKVPSEIFDVTTVPSSTRSRFYNYNKASYTTGDPVTTIKLVEKEIVVNDIQLTMSRNYCHAEEYNSNSGSFTKIRMTVSTDEISEDSLDLHFENAGELKFCIASDGNFSLASNLKLLKQRQKMWLTYLFKFWV